MNEPGGNHEGSPPKTPTHQYDLSFNIDDCFKAMLGDANKVSLYSPVPGDAGMGPIVPIEANYAAVANMGTHGSLGHALAGFPDFAAFAESFDNPQQGSVNVYDPALGIDDGPGGLKGTFFKDAELKALSGDMQDSVPAVYPQNAGEMPDYRSIVNVTGYVGNSNAGQPQGISGGLLAGVTAGTEFNVFEDSWLEGSTQDMDHVRPDAYLNEGNHVLNHEVNEGKYPGRNDNEIQADKENIDPGSIFATISALNGGPTQPGQAGNYYAVNNQNGNQREGQNNFNRAVTCNSQRHCDNTEFSDAVDQSEFNFNNMPNSQQTTYTQRDQLTNLFNTTAQSHGAHVGYGPGDPTGNYLMTNPNIAAGGGMMPTPAGPGPLQRLWGNGPVQYNGNLTPGSGAGPAYIVKNNNGHNVPAGFNRGHYPNGASNGHCSQAHGNAAHPLSPNSRAEYRRQKHIAAEKHRRVNIMTMFGELQQLLQLPRWGRLSKADIVEAACTQISDLVDGNVGLASTLGLNKYQIV
ncbi:hypothetical protein K470DRAFT_286869 [Piedraia hortae CBS 480.64]|uniref:BHLH domain-containing protein n=1 Tax=Piedraia hortae CBS 480.64 TaxID=1314780 RepID=A0A6A7BYU7_9PEZI|nr:hypothetical protein K470DRAFT_286869 [Piedraia hortae CBS 480.64]